MLLLHRCARKLFFVEPGVKERMLEQAVREGDMSFVKYLVTEQGMDVNGEPVVYIKNQNINM